LKRFSGKRFPLHIFLLFALILFLSSCIIIPDVFHQQTQQLIFGLELSRHLSAGQEHWYIVSSPVATRVTIFTTGSTDTYLEVYDTNNRRITQNDDGGQGLNARVSFNVEAGRIYAVKLRGYSRSTNGAYRIIAVDELGRSGNRSSGNSTNYIFLN